MALEKSTSTEKKLEAHITSPHVTQETVDHLNQGIDDNKDAITKVSLVQESNRKENKSDHARIENVVQSGHDKLGEKFDELAKDVYKSMNGK